jgi:hypothetical protein
MKVIHDFSNKTIFLIAYQISEHFQKTWVNDRVGDFSWRQILYTLCITCRSGAGQSSAFVRDPRVIHSARSGE